MVATAAPSIPKQSFFQLSDTRVHLLAFKPSESVPGMHVIRLQENSGQPVSGVSLKSVFSFSRAEAANLVEESNGTAVDLNRLAFRPWETKTIVLKVSPPQ